MRRAIEWSLPGGASETDIELEFVKGGVNVSEALGAKAGLNANQRFVVRVGLQGVKWDKVVLEKLGMDADKLETDFPFELE